MTELLCSDISFSCFFPKGYNNGIREEIRNQNVIGIRSIGVGSEVKNRTGLNNDKHRNEISVPKV